jgi:hypothetical protein
VAPGAKAPSVTTASNQGGYLVGTDDCAAAHRNAGTGNVAGVPYTTGTTGTTGQDNNPACLFFGSDDITNDVWFNWTCNFNSTATLSNCGNVTDTKVAIYNLAVCPGSNSAIACNDDSCGLQSAVSWAATSGTTYTIQLGTFPGASGGSGTFDVTQTGAPDDCRKDDGTTENALGLVAGGELGWLTNFHIGAAGDSTACTTKFDCIDTAYGTAMFPGSVTNGANSQLVIYTDSASDNDPTTGLTVVVKVPTTVVNGDTDILNKILLPVHFEVLAGRTDIWVLASADHIAGQFPAPMDQTPPTHAAGAWVVGSTLGPGSLDTTNLNANDVPPLNMSAIGFPANWLLRVTDSGTTSGPNFPELCMGDGSAAPCGCANESNANSGGCSNSVSGPNGALLSASGTATQDQTSGQLTFNCTNVRTQPGLLFCGVNTIGGGTGATFGDGIRCCGGNVVRVELINPPVGPEPVSVTTTVTFTPAPPGTKRCYQYWYRDPGGPCGANFNLSNAVTVTWQA